MGATALEYRLRYLLHLLIYVVGLWPFWESWVGLTTKSTWLILSADLARAGWLSFQAATSLLLIVAVVFAALGAWLRIWGSAYVGAGVVVSPQMHGQALLADGPYRRTRNPLYLGTLLHTVGLALLMPPAGAVFAIAAIWILRCGWRWRKSRSWRAALVSPTGPMRRVCGGFCRRPSRWCPPQGVARNGCRR